MIDNPFKDPGFWERMQENARIVEKMPTWMKGSPVNRRESSGSADAGKATESIDAESCKVSGSES